MTPEPQTTTEKIHENGQPTGEIRIVILDEAYKLMISESLRRQSLEGEDAPDEF